MEPLNAEVDEWEVAVNRVLLQDVIGRGAFGAVWRALLSSPNGQPGNRTVAAKCFTRKPPSICSIDTYVDLRGGYKNVLFGERGGGKGWSKITSRPTHTPLFFTQGYAGEKKRRLGRSKQTKEIFNQFGRKSCPAIILVSNKWCKMSQAWVRRGLVWISIRNTLPP